MHNLQGDIIALLDQTGTKVVEYAYDAWGKHLAITGTLKNAIGLLNPFRYRGYLYDDETGLYYLRSRYYDPEWGRFINRDTISTQPGAMLSHNLYGYCENSPIRCIDDDGERKAYIRTYQKAKDFGHSEVAVELDNGTIITFSYGIYGEELTCFDLAGEGILEVSSDDRSRKYNINKKKMTMNQYELPMTEDQIDRLIDYYRIMVLDEATFDKIVKGKKAVDKMYTSQRYFAATANCTTTAIESVQYAYTPIPREVLELSYYGAKDKCVLDRRFLFKPCFTPIQLHTNLNLFNWVSFGLLNKVTQDPKR